ncbi:MAG: S24 family peptidase, partial [Planctomycetota bacterium]|nr:S24 family peptidase [Planctomycetota bacterium]
FRHFTMHKIGGRAKAMVVTDSRLMAVRYKLAFDGYIAEKKYAGIKTLVAFSGRVVDPDIPGKEFTETGTNRDPVTGKGIGEKELPERFGTDEYQVLLVAEKYQTGFDQPLLHTMYVDKRLAGLQAVQTLSRLNRTHPAKEDTFILDFVNEPEEIAEAFKPYYEQTLVGEQADARQLYELQAKLDAGQVYHKTEVEEFCRTFYKPRRAQTPDDHAKMNACLDPAVNRFKQLDEEAREELRNILVAYRNLYAFLSQIIPFQDSDLEKLYSYIRFLLGKIPRGDRGPAYDFGDDVALKYYRLQKTSEGPINLKPGDRAPVSGPTSVGTGTVPEGKIELSRLIDILNERFGTNFRPADELFFDQISEDARASGKLRDAAAANTLENFKYVFDDELEKLFIDRMDRNEEIVGRFLDNKDFRKLVEDALARKVYDAIRTTEAKPFRIVQPSPQERFKTCIPLVNLEIAAGGFSDTQVLNEATWVAPNTSRKLARGMFVAKVIGKSMEPTIPDGAYCLFRSPVEGSRNGRIVLVQHREIHDPETAGSFTVKRYESVKAPDKTGAVGRPQVRLHPLNPVFEPIEISPSDEDEVQVVAEFIEALK